MKRFLSIGTFLLCLSGCAEDNGTPSSDGQKSATQPPTSFKYDPQADPEESLQNTLRRAKENGQFVLMVFGSEWCPDCRSFNAKLTQAPLSETVNKHYAVMHVDVGRWDKNMAFADRFEKAASNGIPSIAILDAGGKLLHVTKAGEFASARHAKVDGIDTYLKNKALELSQSALDRPQS